MHKIFTTLMIGLALFSSHSLFAATKLITFSNYFKTSVADATSATVYAGNTLNECTGDSTTTCDGCAGLGSIATKVVTPDGLACNSNSVYPDLNFSVTVSSDQATMYPASTCPKLVMGLMGTTAIAPDFPVTYNPGVANQEITATWKWSTLCAKLGGAGSDGLCRKSFSAQMNVGFDSTCGQTALGETGAKIQVNFRYVGKSDPQTFGCTGAAAYEGFCQFTAFPGDEKVFITPDAIADKLLAAGDQQTSKTPSSADPSGMKYAFLRIYLAEGSDPTVITTDSDYVDLEAISETKLRDQRVKELVNDQQYVFLSANVDQAGNVTLFSDPADVNMNFTETPFGLTQSATPQQVFGLLDDKHCFIATAAFGSGDATEVETLRQFRNRYLLNWEGGRAFVRTYYRISPPIANFIADHPLLKELVRDSLLPVVLLSQLAFRYGVFAVFFLIGLAGFIFFLGVRFLRRGQAA